MKFCFRTIRNFWQTRKNSTSPYYQQELIGNSDKIKGVIDLNFTISAKGRLANHNIRGKDARFSG